MRRIRLDAPRELPAFHVRPATRADWRRWLATFHAECDGVSVVVFKKSAAPAGAPDAADIAEEALCFGWSGGIIANFDDTSFALRLAPRRRKSLWSAKSKRIAAAMETAGLMTAAGRAAIARAQHDGSWTTLDAAESLVVPDDLARAFAKNKTAAANFGKLTEAQRKYFLYHITTAKRPETRAARVAETVRCNALGKKNRLG